MDDMSCWFCNAEFLGWQDLVDHVFRYHECNRVPAANHWFQRDNFTAWCVCGKPFVYRPPANGLTILSIHENARKNGLLAHHLRDVGGMNSHILGLLIPEDNHDRHED